MDVHAMAVVLAGLPGSIMALDAETAVELIKVLDSEKLAWTTLQLRSMRSFFLRLLVAHRLPRLPQAWGLSAPMAVRRLRHAICATQAGVIGDHYRVYLFACCLGCNYV